MSLKKLSIAIVSENNMNRSMAHSLLREKGYTVESFGVKRTFIFGIRNNTIEHTNDFTYSDILKDLMKKFVKKFEKLNENMSTQLKPETFKSSSDKFDIIITCSKKAFDEVMDHFKNVKGQEGSRALVINLNIKTKFADRGAHKILDFLSLVEETTQYIEQIEIVIYKYEKLQKHKEKVLFRWCSY